MWDLIVSVPDHCLSFYFDVIEVMMTSIPVFDYLNCLGIPRPIQIYIHFLM